MLDALKATPFKMLTDPCTAGCGGIASDVTNFNVTQQVPGVGRFKIRWQITPVTGQAQLYFLQARCQAVGGLMASRTVTDLTTFRSCTDASVSPAAPNGCPTAP